MEFNVVIPMWFSAGVVVLLVASVLYHCVNFVCGLFVNSDKLSKYIYEYHEKPEKNGIPRFLRVLHYYHAFRYEYDITTISDINQVVDRVHNRIYTYTTTYDSFVYEVKRVHETYRDLHIKKEQN